MKQVCWKLAASITAFLAAFPLMRFSGWFSLGILIGAILSILYWFDLGRTLRALPDPSRPLRILGLFMGLPQAMFGALTLLIGVSIAAWVLYNTFWHRDPHYSGGFLTLGMSPTMIIIGAGLIADAFRRTSRRVP